MLNIIAQTGLMWTVVILAGPEQPIFPGTGMQFARRKIPDATERKSPYVSNRPPLTVSPLVPLPPGSIEPRGWLRTQLELMRDGFVGHLPELSTFCREDSGWLKKDAPGWEELPYWLRGYVELGLVLGDERIKTEAKRWIDAAVASQDSDGWFGPQENKQAGDAWPNMILLNALRGWQESTGDERILPMMTRYFKYRASRPPGQLFPKAWGVGEYDKTWWQHVRAGDELESIYWLYNRTGEAWLLDLAKRVSEEGADWTHRVVSWHGVNICQGFRKPATYYQQSQEAGDLEATETRYREVYDLYGQVPGGMFGADENCREGHTDPRQAAETCSMVEMMHSCESLLAITGAAEWADRCEDVAFNSLPAAMTTDLKGLHYLTAPNMVQLDRASKAPGLQNGGNMLAYDPWRYRCCQHDVGRGWPEYTRHLWMSTANGGLAAVLYAPCQVKAKVAFGAEVPTEVTITETTDYPFGESVVLTVSTPKPVRFPIYLRLPAWSRESSVMVSNSPPDVEVGAGNYVLVIKTWQDGDKVRLRLPMEVRLTQWEKNRGSVSVHHGPLTFSLKIGEKRVPYGENEKWPAFEVFPTTPWNYGLILDQYSPEISFKVVRKPGPPPAQPFDVDAAPIELTARGRRIEAWQLDRKGLIGPLQQSPVKVDPGEPETITLIPMGCARLRVSAFPTVSTSDEAHAWAPPATVPHEASFEHDDIAALSDDAYPKSSADDTIPRFTFWDHKGTTEWVTFRWAEPRTVDQTHVYWFDDTGTGQCRVPASWRVLWKDGETWKPVAGAKGGGVERDRFNGMTFEPVVTRELKLDIQLQEGYSGGILEWIVGAVGPS